MRVLLVEDDNPLRALQKIVLEETGKFRVIAEAEDGRQAIQLARKHQPDCVLLDLAMPVMGGLEALPRIRDVAPASRIIVVTMLQREGTEKEALSLGADAYVDKGLDSGAFIARLDQVLFPRTGAPPRPNRFARTAAA